MVVLETEKAARKGLAELEQASRAIAAKSAPPNPSSGYKGIPQEDLSCPFPAYHFSIRHEETPGTGHKRMHTGIDIGASQGTPTRPGMQELYHCRLAGGLRNAVVIDHGGGFQLLRSLSSIGVGEGSRSVPARLSAKSAAPAGVPVRTCTLRSGERGEHTGPSVLSLIFFRCLISRKNVQNM